MVAPPRALFLPPFCVVVGRILWCYVSSSEIYGGEFLLWCVVRDDRSRVFSGLGPGYYLVLSVGSKKFRKSKMQLSEFLHRL